MVAAIGDEEVGNGRRDEVERKTHTSPQFDTGSIVDHGTSIAATSLGEVARENGGNDHASSSRRISSLLASSTSVPKLIMISYASWYAVVMALIPHATPKPFLDALVIGVLIGFVLNINAYSSFKANVESMTASGDGSVNTSRSNPSQSQTSVGRYFQLNCMSVLRLFLIPYMVSSYSAAAGASKEGTFVSIFPVDARYWGPALAASVAVPASLLIFRKSLELIAAKREVNGR